MTIKSKDLAKLLGVCPATVSLLLNNKPGISDSLREKLTEQIKELGYGDMLKPVEPANATINAPVPPKKHTIVYAIYTLEDLGTDETGLYAHVLEGCEVQARELGFDLQVVHVNCNSGCSLKDCIKVDECIGVIIQSYQITEWMYEDIKKTGLSFIAVDRYNYAMNLSSVCVNNEDGIYLAVRYLYELGHRNIGYVASGIDANTWTERRRCYHQALREFRLTDRNEFRFYTNPKNPNDNTQVFNSLVEQWSKMDELPTAILCENDIIGVQVLRAARKIGLSVPEDISIIGFDDRSVSHWTDPPLTTVRIHCHLMGRQSVQLLLNLIDMRKAGFKGLPYKVNVGVDLVPRESTAAPKAEIIKLNH